MADLMQARKLSKRAQRLRGISLEEESGQGTRFQAEYLSVEIGESYRASRTMSTGHRITIEPHPKRLRVTFAGETVADSSSVLALREGSLRPVFYFPPADVRQTALKPSSLSSHCPFKGEARYFSLQVADRMAENALWSYESPHEAVAPIRGYLAFYESKVDAITEHPG